MRRGVLWAILLLAMMGYIVWALITLDKRPDKVQIRDLVYSTVDAVRNRNLEGAVACISRRYRDEEGFNYERLRLMAADALRIERPFDVAARVVSIKITGLHAVLKIDARARFLDEDLVYRRSLTVHLNKEHARHAGVIPIRVWRVVRIEGLGLDSIY
ncbi:MAG: hypothetical protein ACUVRS_07360 [Armatimonadota bacterium]